jgi:hypothetical protein
MKTHLTVVKQTTKQGAKTGAPESNNEMKALPGEYKPTEEAKAAYLYHLISEGLGEISMIHATFMRSLTTECPLSEFEKQGIVLALERAEDVLMKGSRYLDEQIEERRSQDGQEVHADHLGDFFNSLLDIGHHKAMIKIDATSENFLNKGLINVKLTGLDNIQPGYC